MGELKKKIFDMLTQIQDWPPEKLLAYQRSQLGQPIDFELRFVPAHACRQVNSEPIGGHICQVIHPGKGKPCS